MRHWCYAFWATCASKKGISSLQVGRTTGLSHRSVVRMMRSVRHVLSAINQQVFLCRERNDPEKQGSAHSTIASGNLRDAAATLLYDGDHEIDEFLTAFKRGIGGVYQSVSEKHLGGYEDEFRFRYNTRGMDDESRTCMAIRAFVRDWPCEAVKTHPMDSGQ